MKQDRTEVGIIFAKLEEARAQLQLVEIQLQRVKLVAPFDGVVITGDLTQTLGAPVNPAGKLADGTELQGPASLRKALLDRQETVVATVTEKMLTYALGRRVEYFDMPAIRAVVAGSARDHYAFSSLVRGIVGSVPFQMKRKEGGTPP